MKTKAGGEIKRRKTWKMDKRGININLKHLVDILKKKKINTHVEKKKFPHGFTKPTKGIHFFLTFRETNEECIFLP